MDVNTTLVRCIRAIPSVMASRIDCLYQLFNSSNTRWMNGELDVTRFLSSTEGYGHLPYPDLEEGDDGYLFKLRRNNEAQFTFDNASRIVADRNGFAPTRRFHLEGSRFDDMPSDVTDEWKSAAFELAALMANHTYWPDRKYDAAYDANVQRRHEDSITVARQFLERQKVVKPCPYERAERLKKLQAEAAALGMALVEVS